MADADWAWKDVAVFVPLAGSAFALTYNAGFFFGLGGGFFTYFTLTEHIVFALQVLPVAIFLAVMVVILEPFLRWFYVESVEPAKRAPRIWFAIGGLGAATFLLVSGLQGYFSLLMMAVFVAAISISMLRNWVVKGKLERIGYILAVCLGAIALIGLNSAEGVLKETTAHETIALTDGSQGEGRLIRAGERGVLFHDTSTKTLTMYRASDVKWIRIKH